MKPSKNRKSIRWNAPSKIKWNAPMKAKSKGKVNFWFGDKDKDGVANIFDCKPFNKKKQGWQPQQFKGSTVVQIPVKRLYYQRGRYGMGNVITPVRIGVHGKEGHQQLSEKKAKELEKKGYKITKVGTKKEGRYDYHGVVKFKRPSKVYKKEIKAQMTAAQFADPMSGEYKTTTPKQYVKNIAKSIKSKKPEVPMLTRYASHLERSSSRFGEGRHRILAAKEAGLKTIPVEIVQDTSYSTDEDIKKLKVQEARDIAKQEKLEPEPETIQHLDMEEPAEELEDEEEELNAQELIEQNGNK